MAYTVTFGNGGRPAKYREYEIDSPDDLTVIGSDADAGSIAHSRSNNTTYKLGNNREWYALTEGGGGGGGESPFFVIPLTPASSTSFTTTVTCQEIIDAIVAGKTLLANVIADSTGTYPASALCIPAIVYENSDPYPQFYGSITYIETSNPSSPLLKAYIVEVDNDFSEPPHIYRFG